MRQHRDASRVRTVISAIEEPSADGAKPHHFEVRAADHAGANDAWLAEPQQGEFDGREIAERADRLRARLEVVDLRNRKGDVLCAETWRVLADVDQTIFVAIDQRPQQHAADHAEDRRVGADAERERDHDGGGQALGALQRAAGDPDVLCEVARGVEPAAVPDPAHRLANRRDVAELAQCGQPRGFRILAALDPLLDAQRQVPADLVVELAQIGAHRLFLCPAPGS